MASALLEQFPDATYHGIDVAPEVGRLYRGDAERARFRSIDSRSFLAETTERFDLVLVVDVLHHVPRAHRDDLLRDVRSLTRPGGHYAIKDWVESRSPFHYAAWASDRLLTGDRVAYFEPGELESLSPRLFPTDVLVGETRVRPRRNNLLLVFRHGE
jgi:2-polyprenyl-6-hydroxyphenyl methylase/3-demethylubiquinone-9 3-methyltransferase